MAPWNSRVSRAGSSAGEFPQIEDALPRDEHVVEHHDRIHLVPERADRMVRRIVRRERLATDHVDALGIDRRREVHALLGRELGPRRRHAEDLVGVGRLGPHAFRPAHDHPAGTPCRDPQGLLLGHRVVAMMHGIAEHRRDAEVVVPAIVEIARDVLGEGRVVLAQQVAHVVEPEDHRRQVLGQASRDPACPAHEALVHAPLARQVVHRSRQLVGPAHGLARAG